MVRVWLRCDLRSPEFGTKTRDLARIHIEQASWADRHGFEAVVLGEHHGFSDGFNPSPMVLGAAIAARTSQMRVHPSALLLPLHDPIRVAEDIAVLDNISGGRVDLTIGLGYVKSEFAMYGVRLEDRARLAESKFEALKRALRGEKFVYEGRDVYITPRPVQNPHPPFYFGGGVKASARRAALLGDGFLPTSPDPQLRELYVSTCRDIGKEPGPIIDFLTGPQFIYVTEDPDRAWHDVAPHALHETNSYSKLLAESGTIAPYKFMSSLEDLKDSGLYAVVTPDECVALARKLERSGSIMSFNPTMSGMNESLSWSSLELFASKVLPRLTSTDAASPE
ncbi:LLM class flavin-dependent oxidoreductase [Sphingobium sp. AN558]|uniref:LLM class flavin-dependent oxidoreductase n=1 Tax=Sphingobium sp. AN558 TaxID=3133442 RepID=UPI0030C2A82E